MSGSNIVPSTAVLAMVEPERLENTVPDNIVSTESRPGRRPSSLSSTSIALKATRECHSTSPISTNSGTGSSVKVLTELNMLRVSVWKDRPPPCSTSTPSMLMMMKANATGIPTASRIMAPVKMMMRMSHHSTVDFPLRHCGSRRLRGFTAC